MIDSAGIRARSDLIEARLRGYRQEDVQAYLGRIALVADVLGEEAGPVPDLPTGFQPPEIRIHEFRIVWRGLEMGAVRSLLNEIADDLQQRLDRADAQDAPQFGREHLRERLRERLHIAEEVLRAVTAGGPLLAAIAACADRASARSMLMAPPWSFDEMPARHVLDLPYGRATAHARDDLAAEITQLRDQLSAHP